MKLLKQENLSNLQLNYNLARGQYGLFLIRFSGINNGAATVSLAELGNIILNWNGKDIVNVDAEVLTMLANIYGGFIENTPGGVGTAFAYSFIVPTSAWFDPKNIYDVSDSDKVLFKFDFPNIMTGAASGSVSISGLHQSGIMSYFHKILSRTVVSGGAGIITDTIVQSNIINLYIKNPAALVSDIQLLVDNNVRVDSTIPVELAYSNWVHLLEATNTFLAEEFAPSKDVREAISNILTYKYTFTGAGNLEQYYSAIEFSQLKQEQSLANARQG